MTNNAKRTGALTPKQRLAVMHLASGLSQVETAKRLGMSRQIVGIWRKDPGFNDAIKELQDKRQEDLQKKYENAQPRAFDIVNEIMENPENSARDRLRAATELRKEFHQLLELREFKGKLKELEDRFRREKENNSQK